MTDRAPEDAPAPAGDEPTTGAPLDTASPPASDSSEDAVVDLPASDLAPPVAASADPAPPPAAEAPSVTLAPAPTLAQARRAAPGSAKHAAPARREAPGSAGQARPAASSTTGPTQAARRAAPGSAGHAKPAAAPAASGAAPAARAASAPAGKEGTGRAKRPAKAAEAGSGTGATKRRLEDAGGERPAGSGTGRKKRPATPDAGDAPGGPSPALLAVGGGLVGALLVAMIMVMFLRPKTPTPEGAQASTEAPPVVAQEEDGAALWRRLNAAQERLAGLQEEADQALVARGVERLGKDLKALRASSIAREAAGTLDRLERQAAALAARDDDGAARREGEGEAPRRSEREAKLASIDEGLGELSFVVEARLFSALQAVPRSLLVIAAEEQQGRGLRDRLRRSVRDAQGAPRALIEVALRPEWVGFLGAAGYDNIASWADDYVGEFRSSEAWRYWQEEQLPRLTESKARAGRFEAALKEVEAAWGAKDHAAALTALGPFRDSRYDIWGTALLGWVERDDVKGMWGSRPLRPRAEAPADAPVRPGEDAADEPRERGSGTGFFVTARVLLTNQHVVKDAGTVRVQMQERDEVEGKVIARDADLDLALVEVQGLEGKPLDFCKESLAVGESVYVYGYGVMITGTGVTNEQAVWTVGALSQFQREDARRLVVFDASVNPGNSGGPLIDCGGNWIGVVVAKTRSLEWIDGYGYAVHGEDAQRWVDAHLGARGKISTAKAPEQPLRASVIARRLPASVVRVVVGGP